MFTHRTIDSPIGPLLLVASDTGVSRIAFAVEDHEALIEAAGSIAGSTDALDDAAQQLTEYFTGQRTSFDLPLDRAAPEGFLTRVQHHLAEIGYGQTRTYREIAVALDNPGAVRAVGAACASNPLPIIQPCHRVLRSDGGLGGFRGGLPAKQLLLDLETGK